MAKMRRTVFVDDPQGNRVRLTKGTEAPDWYDGAAVESDVQDRLVENYHPSDRPRELPDQGPQPGDGHTEPADMPSQNDSAPAPADEPATLDGSTAPVEAPDATLGADAEAAAGTAGVQEGAQEAATEGAQQDAGVTGDEAQAKLDAEDGAALLEGSVSDVLDRVGDNLARAERALAAEQAQPEPRKTLVASLGSLVKSLGETPKE